MAGPAAAGATTGADCSGQRPAAAARGRSRRSASRSVRVSFASRGRSVLSRRRNLPGRLPRLTVGVPAESLPPVLGDREEPLILAGLVTTGGAAGGDQPREDEGFFAIPKDGGQAFRWNADREAWESAWQVTAPGED